MELKILELMKEFILKEVIGIENFSVHFGIFGLKSLLETAKETEKETKSRTSSCEFESETDLSYESFLGDEDDAFNEFGSQMFLNFYDEDDDASYIEQSIIHA